MRRRKARSLATADEAVREAHGSFQAGKQKRPEAKFNPCYRLARRDLREGRVTLPPLIKRLSLADLRAAAQARRAAENARIVEAGQS